MTFCASSSPHFTISCAPRLLFEQIADKWSIMILAVLETEPMRFNELRRRLEGVSQKSLSLTLKRLERNGLIGRRLVDTTPPGVEYSLAPLGQTLLPTFKAIFVWAYQNMPAIEQARAMYDGAAPVQDAD